MMNRQITRPWPFIILGFWVLFALTGYLLMATVPQVWLTDRVVVDLPKGKTVELGRASLGLTQFDRTTASRHLQIENDHNEGIRLFNLSPLHRVDARTSLYKTRYIKRLSLSTGDRIQLDDRSIQVSEAGSDGRLVLTADSGEKVVWENGLLISDRQQTYPDCGVSALKQLARRLRWKLRDYNSEKELSLFSLGGQVQCSDRWSLKELPVRSAKIFWRNGSFLLGDIEINVRERITPKGGDGIQRLAGQSLALDGKDGRINRLVLGRTYFKVEGGESQLLLKPERNIPVSFEAPQPIDIPGVTVETRTQDWIGDNPFAWPGVMRSALFIILMALSFPAAMLFTAIEQQLGNHKALPAIWLGLLPAWTILSFTGSIWGSLNNNLSWGLILCGLAWLLATVQFFRQNRLLGFAGLLWLLLTILAGIGALNLTQLAGGAYNTKWLNYASGHLSILTGMAAAAALIAQLPTKGLQQMLINFVSGRGPISKAIKAGFLLLVILLALAQFMTGDEKGLGWIQPVEFVKLIAIIMLATTLTHLRWMRLVESRDFRENRKQRIMTAISFVMLFIFVSGVMMLGVSDYSPLVIVLTVVLPFLWLAFGDPQLERKNISGESLRTLLANADLRSRISISWTLRGLLLLGLVAVAFYANQLRLDPPDYLSNFPQAERLRIWSDPWAHRLSGDQVVQSLLRVREGGWQGVTHWFGGNGKVMSLPAVQDDFIAAFFINRFGAYTALLLIAVQVLWCGGLLRLARSLRSTPGEFEEYRARYWLGAALTGLAWMQAAHWTISWGNVFGLLPVMGQPMSWLSSGNSHMLAIAFPSMILAMVGAWIMTNDRNTQ